jgi:hypothetical protein
VQRHMIVSRSNSAGVASSSRLCRRGCVEEAEKDTSLKKQFSGKSHKSGRMAGGKLTTEYGRRGSHPHPIPASVQGLSNCMREATGVGFCPSTIWSRHWIQIWVIANRVHGPSSQTAAVAFEWWLAQLLGRCYYCRSQAMAFDRLDRLEMLKLTSP